MRIITIFFISASGNGSSISVGQDFQDNLKEKLPIVVKFVDGIDKLELQVLFALQALSVKHQHPAGLLERLFNSFYENDVVSEDSFIEWEASKNPEEMEGKGVCVKSVQKFINWLRTNDDDTPTW